MTDTNNDNVTIDDLLKTCERAAKIVATWPKWKQEAATRYCSYRPIVVTGLNRWHYKDEE